MKQVGVVNVATIIPVVWRKLLLSTLRNSFTEFLKETRDRSITSVKTGGKRFNIVAEKCVSFKEDQIESQVQDVHPFFEIMFKA